MMGADCAIFLFQRMAGWRYDSADGGGKQYRK
jgi:hypothetical protein